MNPELFKDLIRSIKQAGKTKRKEKIMNRKPEVELSRAREEIEKLAQRLCVVEEKFDYLRVKLSDVLIISPAAQQEDSKDRLQECWLVMQIEAATDRLENLNSQIDDVINRLQV